MYCITAINPIQQWGEEMNSEQRLHKTSLILCSNHIVMLRKVNIFQETLNLSSQKITRKFPSYVSNENKILVFIAIFHFVFMSFQFEVWSREELQNPP